MHGLWNQLFQACSVRTSGALSTITVLRMFRVNNVATTTGGYVNTVAHDRMVSVDETPLGVGDPETAPVALLQLKLVSL